MSIVRVPCQCEPCACTSPRYSAAYRAAGPRQPTSVCMALRCSRRQISGCRHTACTRWIAAANISLDPAKVGRLLEPGVN